MYCLLLRLIEYQFHNRLQPVIYSHPNTRVFVLALYDTQTLTDLCNSPSQMEAFSLPPRSGL